MSEAGLALSDIVRHRFPPFIDTMSATDAEARRKRYRGEIKQLERIIEPFVTKLKWCAYAKDNEKTDPKTLVAHGELLENLYKEQPNMAFKQATMLLVFMDIGQRKNNIWGLPEDELRDWASTMAKRVRLMCRHVMQAKIRKPQPRWLVVRGRQTEQK